MRTHRVNRRWAHRAAAAFVLAVLALGTLMLCIGIPFGGAWALSKVTTTQSGHYIAGLLGLPLAMALFAPVLFWLNSLYLRIRERSLTEGADDGWDERWEEEPKLVPRGPLEPLLMASLAIALVSLIVWFFFFAENPLLW